MMRDMTLKPRECGKQPMDKLLDVLRSIYPEEVAQELFQKLLKDGE